MNYLAHRQFGTPEGPPYLQYNRGLRKDLWCKKIGLQNSSGKNKAKIFFIRNIGSLKKPQTTACALFQQYLKHIDCREKFISAFQKFNWLYRFTQNILTVVSRDWLLLKFERPDQRYEIQHLQQYDWDITKKKKKSLFCKQFLFLVPKIWL